MKWKNLLKKAIAMLVLNAIVMSNGVLVMAAEPQETGGTVVSSTESTMLQDENGQKENKELEVIDEVQLEEENSQLEEESGIVDKNAPELKNITLETTSVAAPGNIGVVVEATDDISGVSSINVRFSPKGAWFNNGLYVDLTKNSEDGKWRGSLKVPASAKIGEYELDVVTIYDTAGNNIRYSNNYFNDNYYVKFPEFIDVKGASFWVISNQIEDYKEFTGAIFEKVDLNTRSVEAPGEIEITVKLSTDSVRIHSVYLTFFGKTGQPENVWLDYNGSGIWSGKIEIDEYTMPGEYKLDSIGYYDSELYNKFMTYGMKSEEIKDEIKNLSYTVINDSIIDKQAPQFKEIFLGADSVAAPGVIDVTVDATDDLSGVYSGIIEFSEVNTGQDSFTVNLSDTYWNYEMHDKVKYEDGKLHGQIQIDQYQASGEYIISSLFIYDRAGNRCYLSRYNNNVPNTSFKVVNDGESTDVTTSTGSADLVKDIREAGNNAVISVDITPNQNIPKEVFDAIKGTDKTLLLNSDDIQWVFKGSNIVGQTKDIDLSGKADYVFSEEYYIGNIPAVGWRMGNNGELPGKATVRFVPNSSYREYLGTEGLYVYYFDSKTGELSLIASNISMKNGNNIEFDITCCKEGVILVTKGMAKTDSTIPQGPETWKSKSGVESFVYRLYNVALSRDAETAGLADWTGRLNTKKENAAQVAWGIFFSPEFKNKCYTDAQFIEMLYQTMFGRTGDNGGKQYWLSLLEKGVSREYVYHGFAESQEFSNLCGSFGVERGSVALNAYRDQNPDATGFIARLYTKMLGRKFDEDGLEDWCKKYLTKENTIEDIASHGFLHSKELDNQNLSDEEFVIRMYETFLNREPEENGLKDWLGRLQRGEVTRDSIVYGFTNSPEFGNLKAEYNLP